MYSNFESNDRKKAMKTAAESMAAQLEKHHADKENPSKSPKKEVNLNALNTRLVIRSSKLTRTLVR